MRPARLDNEPSRLTREFGVPLYQQIQHLIRHRIDRGEYPPGTQIPSENDLCRELNVSRVTLREALRELVRDDMLVKIQGKGTFVNANPPRRVAPVKYAGFLDEIQERFRKLTVSHVDVATVPAPNDVQEVLGLSSGTDVVRIRRVRTTDGEPFSFTINYLPVDIGRRIRVDDLRSTPLLRILQQDLRIPIVAANEVIEAAPADQEVARRLGIPLLYPVMHMKRVMYTTRHRPFELVETYYRADKYHYSVNLVRVKRNGRWTWRTQVETSA